MKHATTLVILGIAGLTGVFSCLRFGETYKAVPPGIWRATLDLAQDTALAADEATGGQLPFNFEVHYATPDSFYFVFHNGDEKIVNRHVRWGHDRVTGKDTLRIDFKEYNTWISANFEEDAIEGFWQAAFSGGIIPFRALHSRPDRFEGLYADPAADISGAWQVSLSVETGHPAEAILNLVQDGNYLTAKLKLPDEEIDNLEGVVDGQRVFLSKFDGKHAYLCEAKILENGALTGIYRTAAHGKTYWTGEHLKD